MPSHTDYFLAILADERIVGARRAAARVRQALRADNARRATWRVVWSQLVGLFRTLASALRRGRLGRGRGDAAGAGR